MFKRKIYNKLLDWKNENNGRTSCLIEGARRIGKSTIAEEFAKAEYESYIAIDFANISKEELSIFDDITDLDIFFLRLQAARRVTLHERKSVIIFDEIQLAPKVRQAIKYLVKDGRYDYIETGSLISIKKNIKGIVIPSEEHRIRMYPMDYEEFLWATGGDYGIIEKLFMSGKSVGNELNRRLMRDFRIYMAVGGMPQAVQAYIEKKDFNQIDAIKSDIINLYRNDLNRIDSSGKLSMMFDSIPAQLALDKKRYVISSATGRQKTSRDDQRLAELADACVALPCYNVANPGISLSQTKVTDVFKLYVADIGLFTTLIFNDKENGKEDIYRKLLSDKLEADFGYMYENAVAQIIRTNDRELYYHTWQKDESTHYYEIDFLLTDRSKIIPVEVKSSSVRNHDSIDRFCDKYSRIISHRYLFSQKDIFNKDILQFCPIYMLPALLKHLDNK